MFKQFMFCLFLVLCEANEEIGVCKKNITVTSSHVVTEQIPFTELVVETCTKSEDEYDYSDYEHYGYEYPVEPRTKTYMCTKIKEVLKYVTKYEQKQVNETHKFCCKGYVQANLTFTTTDELDFLCLPLCDPPCKNGYCSAPDICICMPGYTPSLNETVTCSPVCDLDCGHGMCVEPNICRCDTGYEQTNSTSHAVCTKIILNDINCPHGFKEYNGTCEPECIDGCVHGVCIAPDVCKCDPGYLDHYRFFLPKVCKPECNPGYTKKDGVCRPECKQSCGKGTCVRPNICECFQGYKIDLKQFTSQDNLNGPLCVPLCKNYCPGECVAPNTCVTPPLLSLFTTPASTTSTKSTPKIIPTGISSIPTIIPTAISSISTKIPKIKSTLTTDPITTSRRATTILNLKSTATTESGITTTRKQSVISTTPIPYDPLNNDKNKLSTMATQFHKSTRHMYETSFTTIKYKYQNENKTYKELDHTVTKNNTPTTTETGRGNGAKTWLEQNWVSVLLPIVIVLLAAVIMLAVWRRAPIIIFLRGRSYTVEDDVPDDQDPQFQYSKKKDKVVWKCEDM